MLQRLSLLWKRFTPLEEQLFAQIRTVLPDSMQPIFDVINSIRDCSNTTFAASRERLCVNTRSASV